MSKRIKQLEMPIEVMLKIPPTVPRFHGPNQGPIMREGRLLPAQKMSSRILQNTSEAGTTEAFVTMYLDHRNHVLETVLNSEGTVDHTAVYPREVLKKALELNATGIIFSHNHPAGSLSHRKGTKQLPAKF